MVQRRIRIWLSLAALAASSLAGCIVDRTSRRDASNSGPRVIADRKFVVNGPVRIELANSSGDSRVIAGPTGEVEVHAEFRAKSRLFHDSDRRLNEMVENPPISQESNFIRIGGMSEHSSSVTASYIITVPPDTDIHSMSGSGNVQVNGIKGPANFVGGSGTITASNIAGDVHATVGSGDIRLSEIQGQVQATAGSGDIQLADIRGEIRAQTGSGSIKILKPAASVEANTGSGNISLGGISADVRVQTSSGEVTVDGNPQTNTYWEMRSSSGTVTLRVPPDSNFRLYARTSSGDIDTQIPITMEGTTGKHELRARIGDGKARVEIETSSGKILLH
jgi:DUF4097 and DUF4098 domain-containing protein YvlB